MKHIPIFPKTWGGENADSSKCVNITNIMSPMWAHNGPPYVHNNNSKIYFFEVLVNHANYFQKGDIIQVRGSDRTAVGF